MAGLRKSGEDYLEAILQIKQQKGVVHSVDVANHLGFSKPSVSRAVGLLRDSGHLVMEADGALTLTGQGLAAAEAIYERHEFLTAMLVSLGVPEALAAEDACQIEHVLSETSYRHMREHYYEAHFPKEKEPGEPKPKKKKKKKKEG